MLTPNFLMKYLFRVLHVGSVLIVSQAIISCKLDASYSISQNSILYMLAGIIVIASGIINTFLLKPKQMGKNKKLWMAYHHIKTLTAIVLFTPVFKVFGLQQSLKINLQFYWLLFALLSSSFARFYREHYVALEREKSQNKLKRDDQQSQKLKSEC